MAVDLAKVATICERVSSGEESLRAVCRDVGVPASTFLLWVSEDASIAEQYTRARSIATDAEFEDLQSIADELPEKTAAGSVDTGWVAWQRQRIDARKWVLARRAPKKYGDKLDLNHAGDVSLTVNVVRLTDKKPDADD